MRETPPSTDVDAPATHDIPIPSRHLRLGLGASEANVSTTEFAVPAGFPDEDDTAVGVKADQMNRPKPVEAVTAPRELPATGGRHRLRPPSSKLKARTALVAIAAGAGAIAIAGAGADQKTAVVAAPTPEPEGSGVALAASGSGSDLGPGVAESSAEADLTPFGKQMAVGASLKKERDAREAAARRPQVTSPIQMGIYQLTSAFAPRWGTFHGGIDMAAPLGTPIHAAADGIVQEAGPASGYGHWVQIKAADGTVTMYGHMSSSGVLVQKGQKVTAGDVIALVGNEGFSTGPHLHFEVWKAGKAKIDPAIWLASKGVRLSALTGG